MRVCYFCEGSGKIAFGICACSPEESSFRAAFTDMAILPCQWKAREGLAPDENM